MHAQEIDYLHDAMQNPARKAQIRMLNNKVDTLRRRISSSTWMRMNKKRYTFNHWNLVSGWHYYLVIFHME